MIKDDTTIIIKTFERIDSAKRLLNSIFKYYPDIQVVVSDDSAEAKRHKQEVLKKWPNKNLVYLDLPYDVGLSAGRNLAVAQVKTKYFVLCDDDFIFGPRTDLRRLKDTLEKNNVDLVAGVFLEPRNLAFPVLNYLMRKIAVFSYEKRGSIDLPVQNIVCGKFYKPNKKTLTVVRHYVADDIIDSEIGHNFFIAKTNVVHKYVPWRNELKLLEHLPFFYDLKMAGFTMLVDTVVGVNHIRDMSIHYRKIRYRPENNEYDKLRLKLMDIEKLELIPPIIRKTKN